MFFWKRGETRVLFLSQLQHRWWQVMLKAVPWLSFPHCSSVPWKMSQGEELPWSRLWQTLQPRKITMGVARSQCRHQRKESHDLPKSNHPPASLSCSSCCLVWCLPSYWTRWHSKQLDKTPRSLYKYISVFIVEVPRSSHHRGGACILTHVYQSNSYAGAQSQSIIFWASYLEVQSDSSSMRTTGCVCPMSSSWPSDAGELDLGMIAVQRGLERWRINTYLMCSPCPAAAEVIQHLLGSQKDHFTLRQPL